LTITGTNLAGATAVTFWGTGMLNGLEAEVAFVVDVMLSTERLVDAIRAFEREFPTVALRLHVEALAHRNK
jgi:hypothetical protein